MFPLRVHLLAALVSLALCQYEDYDYVPPSMIGPSSANCDRECECPINFPSAMYCDSRKLKFVPMVPSGIKYLYLQNNQIDEIKPGVFDNVTSELRWLVLDNNQITNGKIASGTIDKLTALEKLFFSHNLLTEPVVPPSKSLDELKMTHNKLNKFPSGLLNEKENLTSVNVQHNELTSEAVAGAFKGSKKLLSLDVSHNKLKKLPVGVPASLEILYADYNDIDSIGSGYLSKVPGLRYLRVSHNKLVDSAGPFGATQLWHNIIRALRAQVEVRRRRRHLRVHANSFSGADAVDAVLSYLMQNAAFGGGGGELSRLTAARLCQALMEARVFEPVGGKLFRRDKETTFEDGGGSLYRFLECKEQECDSDTHEEIKMKMKRNKHSRLNDVHTIANPLAAGPDKKVETLLRSINLRPSPPSTASPSLPQTAVEEVWRRKALLQLLQTMELPVLDGILASPAGVHAGARRAPLQDLVIPNTCLERDLPDALNLPKWDGWLSAAADCLEFLPDQLIAAAGEHLRREGGDGTPERAKRLLFDAIAKHYDGGETAPLLSGRYQDVLVGIVEMLEQARVQRAIRASQLCLHLLQSSTRDELRRLLAFMAAAACPRACRLQRQMDNRTVVCRAFQKAVVHNGQLTRAQSETLVLFLVDNHTDLFKTPTSLTEAVHRTLRSMREGKDADSVATIAFCEQVTAQEYRKRRDRATHESLARLLLHVASSPASGREKRRRLKRFEKHHPVVFLRHLRSNI